ncbi:MAG TPA: DNA starvation/stationary phase protection protein [Bacillales bacterium]|nr:DNA starvation/stationary phase protection protein [Bacillales bacterium]
MQENQRLINFLNQEVSNFAVLYVKLHRYHWFIQGRHFFTLHKKFEELYEEAAGYMDELAERVLAIGGKPLATMTKYLDETTLKEAEADDKESEMLSVLHADLAQIAAELKEGEDLAAEYEDEPSADLMIQIEGALEKHAWMLRATMADK